MRIWDIPTHTLCRKHLLGEHLELHAMWAVLTQNKKGYSHHPETKRWKGKLAALYTRHQAQVQVMESRGYTHKSDLDKTLATGSKAQDTFVHIVAEQKKILQEKGCSCRI